MIRAIVFCVLGLSPLAAMADESDPKPEGLKLVPGAAFGQASNEGVFAGSASGSALAAPTNESVLIGGVRGPGRGNFVVGSGGIYLGAGRYYVPPTRYYHPYFGWSQPQELYLEPFYAYPRATTFYPPLPYLPPREFDADLAPAPPGGQPAEAKRGPTAKEVAQVKRLVEFGDLHFREGNVVEAVRRYKTAVEMAPDAPDLYFRQGIALAVSGQYERAGQALQKGMALDPDWGQHGFRLDELYGAGSKQKEKDLEKLAEAGLKSPRDPLPVFLLGMLLRFDGDMERSAKFLDKANQLGRRNDLAPRPGGKKPQVGGVDL